jgi:hypothetical protein
MSTRPKPNRRTIMSTLLHSRALRSTARETRYLAVRRNGRIADRNLLSNRTNATRWAIQASIAGF